MRQIGEVLRLAAQHLSYDQIAQSVGISRTSVHNYLQRAQQAGLSWPNLAIAWLTPACSGCDEP
jgi:response regulator of citrate/malate metabolism